MNSHIFSLSRVAAEVTRLKTIFFTVVVCLIVSQAAAEDLSAVFHSLKKSIPEIIQPVLNSNWSIGERLDAVHSLGKTLSRAEIGALYHFVATVSGSAEKDLPELYGLKNDILNVLRNQTAPPEHFTETIVAIYRNPAQDPVIRDYAIQHLATWYEQGAPDSPDSKEKIRAVFHDAVKEPNGIAGTALLSMHRLSASDRAFDGTEIDELALNLARSADLATRITAIQVCSQRGLKEVLPIIASIPQKPGSLPLRLSAVAALGHLGAENGEIQILEYQRNGELKMAVESALNEREKKRLF